MRVVLDANVVFAGVGWRGEAHSCLLAMARRRITVFATLGILDEVRVLVSERGSKFKHKPHNLLTWSYERVKLVEPALLFGYPSRDACSARGEMNAARRRFAGAAKAVRNSNPHAARTPDSIIKAALTGFMHPSALLVVLSMATPTPANPLFAQGSLAVALPQACRATAIPP